MDIKKKVTRTIDILMAPRDSRYGAPMGRVNKGTRPTDGTRVFDCKVPMIGDGAYSRDGTYWGLHHGGPLRVSYTKSLSYYEFYWDTTERRCLEFIDSFWESIDEVNEPVLFDRDQCDMHGQDLLSFHSYSVDGVFALNRKSGNTEFIAYYDLRPEDLLYAQRALRFGQYTTTSPD